MRWIPGWMRWLEPAAIVLLLAARGTTVVRVGSLQGGPAESSQPRAGNTSTPQAAQSWLRTVLAHQEGLVPTELPRGTSVPVSRSQAVAVARSRGNFPQRHSPYWQASPEAVVLRFVEHSNAPIIGHKAMSLVAWRPPKGALPPASGGPFPAPGQERRPLPSANYLVDFVDAHSGKWLMAAAGHIPSLGWPSEGEP